MDAINNLFHKNRKMPAADIGHNHVKQDIYLEFYPTCHDLDARNPQNTLQ